MTPTLTRTPSPTDSPPPAPRLVRVGVLVFSSGLGVSALAGLGVALLAFPGVLLAMAAYEAAVVMAAVFGVLLGLGRFREGFGLACLCVAGTVVTGAFFGVYKDLRVNTVTPGQIRAADALLVGRVLGAGAVAGLGALAVLSRDARSWPLLAKGVLIGSPVVVVGGWLVWTRGAALSAPVGETAGTVRTIAVILGGLVLMVLGSIGAHLCIRAFEVTRPDDQPPV